MLQPGQDVQLCRRSRSQRVADCFACLNGSLFMTRKFEPSAPLLDKLARCGKSHSNCLRIEITLALGRASIFPP